MKVEKTIITQITTKEKVLISGNTKTLAYFTWKSHYRITQPLNFHRYYQSVLWVILATGCMHMIPLQLWQLIDSSHLANLAKDIVKSQVSVKTAKLVKWLLTRMLNFTMKLFISGGYRQKEAITKTKRTCNFLPEQWIET